MTNAFLIGGWELPVGEDVKTLEDKLFRAFVLFAMVLEIVVFHEPAPVDAAIVFCLVLGLFLGKVRFRGLSSVSLGSLAAFALANLLSMYNPFDLTRAVWYLFVTLYLIASWFFFVGVIGHYGPRFMASLIDVYCVAGLISAALGVLGYFHLVPYWGLLLLQGRARGLFKDCNVYGPYFVAMALFALLRLMDPVVAKSAKVLASVYFLSASIAMLLCFSRACWLNFGVALAVFFLLQALLANSRPGAKPRIGGLVIVLAVCTVMTTFMINTPAVKDMLDQRVTRNGLQDYDRVRFATQALALDSAEQHPFGIGPGQAEQVFGYATHSMYLRILSENGVVALVAILVFIAATIARAWSNTRQMTDEWTRNINLVVLACIAGHLANSVVIDTVHWRHIWFIYALPWASAWPARFGQYLGTAQTAKTREREVRRLALR